VAGSWRSEELTGFVVGLTAQRRAAEFNALLARHGAKTMHAPAIRIVHLLDDDQLLLATEALITKPADVLVVTTGFGFRGWIDAAHAWGLTESLFAVLGNTRIVARGPKALGAIRQAGLREEWSARSESSVEVVEQLTAEAGTGLRVAVQLHGAGGELEPNADVCQPLSAAGADILRIPVYRWRPPSDLAPMDRLINTMLEGGLDAVTFTSAPAVASLVDRARSLHSLPALVAALNQHTMAACVGPVTAAPLNRLGVPTVMPARYRLGALARLLLDELPRRETRVRAGGHELKLRRTGILVDGEWRPVPPTGMAMLRQLISAAGQVVSANELIAASDRRDAHATHMAVKRLRAHLGAADCIQTVDKRGYRIVLQSP
jgi:uroporphyrinogen-III synthase